MKVAEIAGFIHSERGGDESACVRELARAAIYLPHSAASDNTWSWSSCEMAMTRGGEKEHVFAAIAEHNDPIFLKRARAGQTALGFQEREFSSTCLVMRFHAVGSDSRTDDATGRTARSPQPRAFVARRSASFEVHHVYDLRHMLFDAEKAGTSMTTTRKRNCIAVRGPGLHAFRCHRSERSSSARVE